MLYLKRDLFKLSCSSDYKARYVAEYLELEGRKERLKAMLTKYVAGTLDFEPTCPLALLKEQLDVMEHYISILLTRALLENVDFDNLDGYIKPVKEIQMLPQHPYDTCRSWTLSGYTFIDKGTEYEIIDGGNRKFVFSHIDEGKTWKFVY